MSTIIALHHKRGENFMQGYTWTQCSTHPQFYVSVVIAGITTALGGSQSRLFSPVVGAKGLVSSSPMSKQIWGESVNWKHCTAKMKNVYSKVKVQPHTAKGQIELFVIAVFLSFVQRLLEKFKSFGSALTSVDLIFYTENNFSAVAFILRESMGLLTSASSIIHCNHPHRLNHALIHETKTHNSRINLNPRNR